MDVDQTTGVLVDYQLTHNTSVAQFTRLFVVSKRVGLCRDAQGTTALVNPVQTDSSGRAGAYVKGRVFDYLVSSPDFTTRGYFDLVGGWRPDSVNINALDFPTLQDAVDAIPASGGIVRIPAGVYHRLSTPAFHPPLVLPHDRAVSLIGDGPAATRLSSEWPSDPDWDKDSDFVQLTGDHQLVEGIGFSGSDHEYGAGCGIRIWRNGGAAALVYGAAIRDCSFDIMPSARAIYIDNAERGGSTQFAVFTTYDRVETNGSSIVIPSGPTTTQYFKNCRINSGQLMCEGVSGVSLIDCILEGWPYTFINLNNCTQVLVHHCHLEGAPSPDVPFIKITCAVGFTSYQDIAINSCSFVQTGSYG